MKEQLYFASGVTGNNISANSKALNDMYGASSQDEWEEIPERSAMVANTRHPLQEEIFEYDDPAEAPQPSATISPELAARLAAIESMLKGVSVNSTQPPAYSDDGRTSSGADVEELKQDWGSFGQVTANVGSAYESRNNRARRLERESRNGIHHG